MSFSIDWIAFVQVFVAAMIGAVLVVSFYSLGLRLLVRAGRAPVVTPAEFTDAITVITPKDAQRAAKAAAKAARKSPLTDGQKCVSLWARVPLLRDGGPGRARRAAAHPLQPLIPPPFGSVALRVRRRPP